MPFIDNCGLMLEPQEGMSVEEIIDWAEYAEKSGYGYIFRSDHLLPTSGRSGLGSPECWVTLGAIAAATKSIKFGPMVSPIGFRNPALLAKMACTLHSYSHGRLVLSIGAGWYQREYEAHGFRFPDEKERKKQFYEALQIIRPLTQGERVTFKGTFFSADTEAFPKPESGIHLVVGGRDGQIIRWAGELADELNMYSPKVEVLQKAKRILKEPLAKNDISISQMGPFFIAESQDALNAKVSAHLQSAPFQLPGQTVQTQISKFKELGIPCGVLDDFIAQIKEKVNTGISKFYFQLLNPKDREMADLLTKTLRQM
jgi:alkanesulfonate monooxygenase SsuD/methylene tetrahydromethanopterin reductase-like flavin-dependent oxidoreductase (luciferase family)